MAKAKLRVGVVGLGRIGKRHVMNFYAFTPRATVVAVISPDVSEREWAAENLEGVEIYSDYDEMLAKADLQAILIATITSVHAEQTIKAMAKGYHVLCEKPLSIDVGIAQSVLDAYNESLKTYPDLKVMCGFPRRFDESYQDAHGRISRGEFGRPIVIHSQTADLLDKSGFFVEYSKNSGGIFVDCSIHDIDLLLWFFGENSQVKSLQAIGVTSLHHELEANKDRDNALATIEFYGGQIAALYGSRTMAAGQEDTTEVICDRGSLRINKVTRKNHVEIHDSHGSRRDLPLNSPERFREAFITESNEFTSCCLDGKPVPISLASSVKAVAIGTALQQSLISGKKFYFDEQGVQIPEA